MPTYQSTNSLARTNPLRSIPFLRPATHVLRPVRSPLYLAQWELDRATPDVPSAEKQYVYARQCLGDANRYPRGIARRNAQAQAMRFLNKSRAKLRAARKRLAAAKLPWRRCCSSRSCRWRPDPIAAGPAWGWSPIRAGRLPASTRHGRAFQRPTAPDPDQVDDHHVEG